MRPARPDELPPGYPRGLRYAVPLVEMPAYLPHLHQEVLRAGAQHVLRRVAGLRGEDQHRRTSSAATDVLDAGAQGLERSIVRAEQDRDSAQFARQQYHLSGLDRHPQASAAREGLGVRPAGQEQAGRQQQGRGMCI